MILSIIGIVLGLIAIGLFVWLKQEQEMNNALHEGDLEVAKHAYTALMDDFNNYQVDNERKIAELEKQLEIKSKNAERRMDNMNKSLPSVIRTVVGHIEFAKPLDKKIK